MPGFSINNFLNVFLNTIQRENAHEFKVVCTRFYGVMVSTLDSESSDPSSNLGRTCKVVLLLSKIMRSLSAKKEGSRGIRTPDLQFTRLAL